MTDFNASIRLGLDAVVLLRIVSAQTKDDWDWDCQLALIRSTGATFHDDKAWYLRVDGPSLTTDRLLPLWRAVAEYGTSVRIERIDAAADVLLNAGG